MIFLRRAKKYITQKVIDREILHKTHTYTINSMIFGVMINQKRNVECYYNTCIQEYYNIWNKQYYKWLTCDKKSHNHNLLHISYNTHYTDYFRKKINLWKGKHNIYDTIFYYINKTLYRYQFNDCLSMGWRYARNRDVSHIPIFQYNVIKLRDIPCYTLDEWTY